MKKFNSIKLFGKLFPLAAGILFCMTLIFISAKDNLAGLEGIISFLTGTFSSTYYIGLMLNTGALLLTAGTGALVALRSGNMNIGGEGQIYMGGFAAALVCLYSPFNFIITLIFAALASMVSSGFMTLISAFLRQKKGVPVLLTSFLVSSTVIPIIDAFIIQSKNNSDTNILALPYINDNLRLMQILEPSPLNTSFFYALFTTVFFIIILDKTSWGRKTTLWGKAPKFAEYAGYSSKEACYSSVCLSGALHGLTGFFAITGTYYSCHMGFYSGYGWNALSLALLAQSGSGLILIPWVFALSWLFTSAERVSLIMNFGYDLNGILQGIILFSIALTMAIPAAAKKITGVKK